MEVLALSIYWEAETYLKTFLVTKAEYFTPCNSVLERKLPNKYFYLKLEYIFVVWLYWPAKKLC